MSAIEIERQVDTERPAPAPVTLHGDDVFMAQNAVRTALSRLAGKYRRELRIGHDDFAASRLEQFDRYLDLYERLGGDPTEIRDPEDGGGSDG